MDNARTMFDNVTFCRDAYETAEGADALVIATEWNEFRALNLDRVKKLLRHPVIVDLRNVYDPQRMRSEGFQQAAALAAEVQHPNRSSGLPKHPPDELLEVIRQVHAGKKRIPPEIAAHLAEHYSDKALSQREIEVLQRIAAGKGNRYIGEKLFISELTVKMHIKHIMEKLGATDRTQAFAIGVRRGIISL